MKKTETVELYCFNGALIMQCKNAFTASQNDRRALIETVQHFGTLPEMLSHIADFDTQSARVKSALWASFYHAIKYLSLKSKHLNYQDYEDAFMMGLGGLYALSDEDMQARMDYLAGKQTAKLSTAQDDEAYLQALQDIQSGLTLYTSAVLYELSRQFGLGVAHYATQWADDSEYTTELDAPIDGDGNTVEDTIATVESRDGYQDTRNLNAYALLRAKYDITRAEYSTMLKAYITINKRKASATEKRQAVNVRYQIRKKYGIGIIEDMDGRKAKTRATRADKKHDGLTRSQRSRAKKAQAKNR